MASSNSSSNNSSLAQPSEKLTKTNNTLWYAQVRATLRGAKMMGYLTGEARPPPTHIPKVDADGKEIKEDGKARMMPNLEFEDWDAADQQVLSYLLGSLSKDILVHVTSCTTSTKACATIEGVLLPKHGRGL
jgi:hypothetical protein